MNLQFFLKFHICTFTLSMTLKFLYIFKKTLKFIGTNYYAEMIAQVRDIIVGKK